MAGKSAPQSTSSNQEVGSLGWNIKQQGNNYRIIAKKDKKRFADLTIDPNGTIVKGFMDDGQQRRDLAGQNFVAQGNAAIKSVLGDLQQAESSAQAALESGRGSQANTGSNVILASFQNVDSPLVGDSESLLLAASGFSCLNSCFSSAGLPLFIIGNNSGEKKHGKKAEDALL